MPKSTNIFFMLIIGAALMASCSARPPVDQAALDNMAAACNLPKKSAVHHPDDTVELKISQDASFDDVGCLLGKLKAAGVKNLGFIGNEQRGTKDQK